MFLTQFQFLDFISNLNCILSCLFNQKSNQSQLISYPIINKTLKIVKNWIILKIGFKNFAISLSWKNLEWKNDRYNTFVFASSLDRFLGHFMHYLLSGSKFDIMPNFDPGKIKTKTFQKRSNWRQFSSTCAQWWIVASPTTPSTSISRLGYLDLSSLTLMGIGS